MNDLVIPGLRTEGVVTARGFNALTSRESALPRVWTTSALAQRALGPHTL
jgi:hypothetical protein